MVFLASNNNNNSWVYIIIGAVAFILIAIVLFFFLKNGGKKKYLQRVDNLLGQIKIDNSSQLDTYLARLKSISKKNDEYVPIYEQLTAQYEKIQTTDKEKLITRQRGLHNRINEEKKMTKGLIEQIKSLENAIAQFKKELLGIQTDLESYFKEGDELRVKLTTLQKEFQQINNDMETYSASLDICKKELYDYLSDVEMYFDVLDDNISSARYKEANKNVDRIEKMLLNVYGNIETIAQYCNMVESIIPNQLQELQDKSVSLEKQGYVVAHAKVNDFIANTKEILQSCKNDFKHLCFGNFDDILYEIQSKLSEVHAHLDQEVMSKHDLEVKYKAVSEKIENSESEFIKTKRSFSMMLEYYKLPDEIHDRFNVFQKNATYLSDLKREYEGYMFVNAKHPASFLLEKVARMDALSNEVLDDIKYFSSYFKTVKDYVENTFTKVDELLILLTKTIGNVRKNKCKAVYYKYIESVSRVVSSLKNVNQILLEKPINIEILYAEFSGLVSKAEELDALIKIDLNNYQIVEKCIVFANPLRFSFVEVDKMLLEIEDLFKKGNYKVAQEKINYILNNYHPAAYDSFKG